MSALQPAIICKPLPMPKNNRVNMHSCRANRQNFNKRHVTAATIKFNGPEPRHQCFAPQRRLHKENDKLTQ